jgi:hypothetical protein
MGKIQPIAELPEGETFGQSACLAHVHEETGFMIDFHQQIVR